MTVQAVPPASGASGFNCPWCHAFAEQTWWDLTRIRENVAAAIPPTELRIAICRMCSRTSIWVDEWLIHPESQMAPPPNPDLPEEIQRDYREAASITDRSPRGAAALLRLCIQKLCVHLGLPGANINADIAALVAQGLPRRIQQSLDILRVVGNSAAHPGKLDLTDDVETVLGLFALLNLIAEDRISEPRRIEALYGSLPESSRQAIEARDQHPLDPGEGR